MEEFKSKSQKKRDVIEMQKLGVDMIDLSESDLDQIPLPSTLKKAIIDAKTIKSHEARRRQEQLIGKLMRSADYHSISKAFNDLIAEQKGHTALFHEIEAWRIRLIEEEKEALSDFINHYQPNEIQQLRQLIKKVKKESQNQKNVGAAKALFRYLRSIIQ